MNFLTEAELGDLLGVRESKIAEWRRRYGWPHVKFGREIRFSDTDVQAIAAQHHKQGVKAETLPGQTALSAARSAR